MTTQGSIRQGRGGIRAAWREIDSPSTSSFVQQPTSASSFSQSGHRKKRKVKSIKTPAGIDDQLHYHSTGLYRGKCPPEEPPMAEQEPLSTVAVEEDTQPDQQSSATPTKTQARYYYYSESDDYGSVNMVNPLRSGNNTRRGQRHLSRVHRTLEAPNSKVKS